MNKKLHYNAPETEVVEIKMEGGILSASNQAPNVQTLDSGDIYDGDCTW